MQHIHMSFGEFLRKHFQFLDHVIKCAVEAVKLGLLHKDCVNCNGTCLAVMLLEYAVHSLEQEACMPFLDEFFAMKPCMHEVLPGLRNRLVELCMSFEYFWTAAQEYWWAMPMDVRKKWSPCRVAWIWAVVQ